MFAKTIIQTIVHSWTFFEQINLLWWLDDLCKYLFCIRFSEISKQIFSWRPKSSWVGDL